jgi:hypothetical protein
LLTPDEKADLDEYFADYIVDGKLDRKKLRASCVPMTIDQLQEELFDGESDSPVDV